MKQQVTKDGHVMTATSATQLVRLRFDGWQPVVEEPAPDPEPDADGEDEPKTKPRKRTQ